jgi:hypothetical protein
MMSAIYLTLGLLQFFFFHHVISTLSGCCLFCNAGKEVAGEGVAAKMVWEGRGWLLPLYGWILGGKR